jgi:dipeptidyl aminopeptidase/acylaminoacyl peptidase
MAAIIGLAAISLLTACAAPPPADKSAAAAPAPPVAVFPPNPNLVADSIPPVPQSLVDQVERYTRFRGHAFVDWHPTKAQMIVAHRLPDADTVQLFRLGDALGTLQPLTSGPDPVSAGLYEPRTGRYIVFSRASGGNEVYRLYRLDPQTRAEAPITPADERSSMLGWMKGGGKQPPRLLVSAVPVDRTAAGGSRASITTTIWAIDPDKPQAKRKVAELPGGGWFAPAVRPDDRELALTRYLSANESQIWTLDLQTGKSKQVLPAAGDTKLKAQHTPAAYSPDGRYLFFTSNRFGEFAEMMRLDRRSGTIVRLTTNIPWDVEGGSISEDGRLIALEVNVDGRGEMRLFDGRTLKERPAPALPPGSVGGVAVHPRLPLVAFATNSVRGPSQLHLLDTTAGSSSPWTQPYVPEGIATDAFNDQRIVRWKSFDGRTISGIVTPPPARFTGRRPVIIDIHGGPEAQARVGFMGRDSYFVNELGIAVIEPNVRGSSGYGKTFLKLDDGFKREDSVKDIGTLLDWIAQQPDLDPSRVMVTGGSYGGYISLAVSVHYADRIAGAIDAVGISSFVTFLTNTESYRRDLRRAEYGDERDPKMREFQERISPLNNTDKIRKPLFVVQGRNDPRVPYTEAEQIVSKVRAGGTPVWYLRAENEGHGFARKENSDYLFYATILFVQQTLLR